METVIGFVVGYLVGSSEGKAGLERARSSFRAIISSPEVRRLAGEAVSFAEMAVKQQSSRGLGKLGGTVARTVAERLTAETRHDTPRAA